MSNRNVQEGFSDDPIVLDQSNAAAGGCRVNPKDFHERTNSPQSRKERKENSLRQKFRPSGREDPEEIVVKGKEHQQDNEDESDLLGDFHFLDTDGPS